MNILKTLIKYIITFLILIFVFSLLLTLSNFISRDKLLSNVMSSSVEISEYREIDEHAPNFYDSYKMDYYTDSVMINIAYFSDPITPFVSAMFAPSYGWGVDSLKMIRFDTVPNTSYSRYWHGYLIFLRPLLTVFDYTEIGIFNTYVLYLLLGACIILFYKKIGAWFSFSVVFTLVLLNITILPINMQLISMILLSMIGMIIAIYLYEKRENLIPIAFFVMGMFTIFFDFYTYAILTFGLPAIVLTLLYSKDQKISLKEMVKKITLFFALWLVAYILTWVTKIALATLVLGEREFELALISFKARLSREVAVTLQEKIVGGLASLNPNLSVDQFPLWVISLGLCAMQVFNPASLAFIGIILIIFAVLFTIYKRKTHTFGLVLLMISLLPIIWYVIAVNPTIVHFYFQFRGLGVTTLGVLATIFISIDFENPRIRKSITDDSNKKNQ